VLKNDYCEQTEDFAKTRELLVGAETSKKHLEQRVEDLGKQLQGNQEKLSVYEHRPVGRITSASNGQVISDSTREQQLEAELAELRASAKMLEFDLARARENVQQFQAISETNEAALASLSATHEEYKASAEAELSKLKVCTNRFRV
jgi:nucleoprotein TPR